MQCRKPYASRTRHWAPGYWARVAEGRSALSERLSNNWMQLTRSARCKGGYAPPSQLIQVLDRHDRRATAARWVPRQTRSYKRMSLGTFEKLRSTRSITADQSLLTGVIMQVSAALAVRHHWHAAPRIAR